MASAIAHLHVHTSHSTLDGAAKLDEIARAAAADGQPALAITDHGTLSGVPRFVKACRDEGVKPIVGFEAYMAEDRTVRGKTEQGKQAYHLTMLAADQAGWRNLVQVSSRAYLEGYFYKPRLDWEVLADHAEGIVVTTGCLGGIVCQRLMAGDDAGALEAAGRLAAIYGRDRTFVELQDHGLEDQAATNPRLVELARRLGLRTVATNDCHYTNCGDAAAHDLLLCVQTGSRLDDPDRFSFGSDQHYLKTADEMRRLFSWAPEACDATLEIAEMCDLDLAFGDEAHLPRFPVPDGHADEGAYLQSLVLDGARQRYGDPLPAEVADRLAYELRVVNDAGYPGYFLLLHDLISWCRAEGIRTGPGRGSAAGSAVAYCLRITDIDPIRYGLLFERFLNPSRVSMPDIDVDYEARRRKEVIEHLRKRWGEEAVTQISTFSRIKARSAVKDAARALGLPPVVGARISGLMPPLISGRDTPLGACLVEDSQHAEGYALAADLRSLVDRDDEAKRVVTLAQGIEGLVRAEGVHPSAVVVCPGPTTEFAPVKLAKDDDGDRVVATQWDGDDVEAAGLLKLDVLGLRNLDIITDTVATLAARGVDLDLDHLPLDDQATYDLLGRGDAIGVFQMEGQGMRTLLRQVKPTSLDDLAAVVALYRPGPMGTGMHVDYARRKHGAAPAEPFHPAVADVLADTYGLMIYQEQLMRVAQVLAGYSLADADLLRKATGKKILSLMAAERAKFVAGCEATGHGRAVGEATFDIIEPFASYSFNKSHAVCYGFIGYLTAYLKAHHPTEYLAALIDSFTGRLERAAVYLRECVRLGIKVLPPDVNTSAARSVPEDGAVRLGLGLVRSVGTEVAEALVAERERGGLFTGLADLCGRCPDQVVNKRVLEALAQAGAMDEFASRPSLMAAVPHAASAGRKRRAQQEAGALSLFAGAEPVAEEYPPAEPWPLAEQLERERAVLGVYVSAHPLDEVAERVEGAASHAVADLAELPHDRSVELAGLVANVDRRSSKAGKPMLRFTLEDLTGQVDVLVPPRSVVLASVVEDGVFVVVDGRLDAKDEDAEPKVVAAVVDPLPETLPPTVTVAIPEDADMADLRRALAAFPGRSLVYVRAAGRLVRLPRAQRVDAGRVHLELVALYGAANVEVG